jgi:hypothetical protein
MDGRLRPNSETRRDFIQMSDDKFTFAALVDAGGYSTAIQQKYQGMLVTESIGLTLLQSVNDVQVRSDALVCIHVTLEVARKLRRCVGKQPGGIRRRK